MNSDLKEHLSSYLSVSVGVCVLATSSCMPHSSSMVTQASMGKAISLPLMFRCSSRDLPKDGFSTHASAKTNQHKLEKCLEKLQCQYLCIKMWQPVRTDTHIDTPCWALIWGRMLWRISNDFLWYSACVSISYKRWEEVKTYKSCHKRVLNSHRISCI